METRIAAAGRIAARTLAMWLRDSVARAVADRQRSQQRHQHIAEFDSLLRLNDRLIADIGLKRAEVGAMRHALLRKPKQTRAADDCASRQPSIQSS